MNENITSIHETFPDGENLHLKISVGACRIKIAPGEGDAWVSGTYTDPHAALPLKIEREGGTLRITQDRIRGEWLNLTRADPPRFDLVLGKNKAYILSFEGGASEGSIDLGGLPITRLRIDKGAGQWDFNFSAPNPQAMSLLDVNVGAASLKMDNLANANFHEMSVDGGASSYEFDFDGQLQQDGDVRISTGVASVEVKIPPGIAAKIYTETTLGSLQVGDGFTKKGGAFWNQAALEGQSPTLTLNTKVALGSLTLDLA